MVLKSVLRMLQCCNVQVVVLHVCLLFSRGHPGHRLLTTALHEPVGGVVSVIAGQTKQPTPTTIQLQRPKLMRWLSCFVLVADLDKEIIEMEVERSSNRSSQWHCKQWHWFQADCRTRASSHAGHAGGQSDKGDTEEIDSQAECKKFNL